MSKKGFLTGLIFKDEGQTEQGSQVSTASAVTGSKGPGTPIQTFTSTPSVQGVIDNKFVDMLTAIIEQSNLPGQDYFEFKQAIENMKSIPGMSDQQKFQTVYTVLSMQGCTKEVLLSSLEKYIGIIQNEKTNFDKEMQTQFQTKVNGKLSEVDKAKQELEGLGKRMTELNNIILTCQQEAGAEEMKLRATEANFKASADIIINEMIGDKQKINDYIK